jgi:hypothetical protein
VNGRRLRVATAGAVVLAVALAACGGNDGTEEDEEDITAAIEFATASGDPAACTEVQTQRFLEQVGDETEGEAAVRECEKNAADPIAKSISVSNIEVDGDSATAEGAISGALFDGQTFAIALVKEGGQWKLDEATGFVGFDRDTMLTSLEREFTADPETPPQAAECVVKQFSQLSDQEIQDYFLGRADPQAEEAIFGHCFGAE